MNMSTHIYFEPVVMYHQQDILSIYYLKDLKNIYVQRTIQQQTHS